VVETSSPDFSNCCDCVTFAPAAIFDLNHKKYASSHLLSDLLAWRIPGRSLGLARRPFERFVRGQYARSGGVQ
jgi:hypothetical protein